EKFSCIRSGLRVELALPLPHVLLSAESADDPLSNVPVQVQKQIANAVRLRIGSPPDLRSRDALHGLLDARKIAFSQESPRLIDERPGDVGHRRNCTYSVHPGLMRCRSITAQREKAGISPGLDVQEEARLAFPLPRDDVVLDLVERRLRN